MLIYAYMMRIIICWVLIALFLSWSNSDLSDYVTQTVSEVLAQVLHKTKQA